MVKTPFQRDNGAAMPDIDDPTWAADWYIIFAVAINVFVEINRTGDQILCSSQATFSPREVYPERSREDVP
jgi:hypothetical protein